MECLDRSGINLFYEDIGKGRQPLLMVHDLACDHTSFMAQIQHFCQSHRVVAIDLPGHGRSDKPRRNYTVRGFAEDLAWLCFELGLHRPLLVGHGLGGMIAIELAVRYPDLPAGVVALEPMILPPIFGKIMQSQFLQSMDNPGYRMAMQRFVRILLPSGRLRTYFQETLEAASMLPQYVASSVLENSLDWDLIAKVKACSVPLLYLDAGVSDTNLAHIRTLGPRVQTGRIEGSGHFPQAETPIQVNEEIEKAVVIAMMDQNESEYPAESKQDGVVLERRSGR